MSTQRSSALQGIVGVFLALGIIGGISILGTGGLLSQSTSSGAADVAPALDAPQAEFLAPAPEAELVEPPLDPEPEDAPEPVAAERVADVDVPAEIVEEVAAAGEAARDQEAPIIPEIVDIPVEQVDLANEVGLPAREDLTRIFSILILSAGVGIAVMLSMIFVQRRS